MEGLILLALIVGGIVLYSLFKNKKTPPHAIKSAPEISPPTPFADFNNMTTNTVAVKTDEMPELDDEVDPDKDAWEGSFIGTAISPLPAKATFEINYIDAQGQETRRIVDVREFDESPYCNLMIGHCRLRNATRTFRFDRIKECIDIETGAVVQDVVAFLRAKYEVSPEATLDKVWQGHYDLLRILFFIAKADGRLIAKERLAILDYVKDIANDERLDDSMIKCLCQAINIPSLLAYKRCCGDAAKNLSLENRERLLVTAGRIVSSEKKINPAEQEALEYLRKRLSEKEQNA